MIEQAMQLHKRYRKMVEGFKEEDFKGWFVEFFKLYPYVTSIKWVQYAPYFNDGDPCVFSVHEPEMELSESFIQKHDLPVSSSDYGWDSDDEDEDGEGRILQTYSFKAKAKDVPQLAEALKSLKELFTAEDILQHVFGTDAKIVATPEKIEVDEYQHD